MRHYQDTALDGLSDDDKTIFRIRMKGVCHRDRQGIIKRRHSFFEGNPMFAEIDLGFSRILFKQNRHILLTESDLAHHHQYFERPG